MSEVIVYSRSSDRATIYREIRPQIESLIAGESDLIANLANVTAVLRDAFSFLWVGFYLEKDGELVLGPFQGPVACTRIPAGCGVCGKSFADRKTIVVPDVNQFPGHIACSQDSKSEIVVPIFREDSSVFGVLDVDSDEPDNFSGVDVDGLQKIVKLVEKRLLL